MSPSNRVLLRPPYRTALVATLLFAAGVFLSIPIVPPRSQTVGTFHTLRARILDAIRAAGSIPTDLTTLPTLPDRSNSTLDAWGHPVSYKVRTDDENGLTEITLTSLGKDNRPGGTGDDADIIGTFVIRRRPDGRLRPDLDWVRTPLPHGPNLQTPTPYTSNPHSPPVTAPPDE